jgi:uncharacterized protein YfaP (DUF2135 family)
MRTVFRALIASFAFALASCGGGGGGGDGGGGGGTPAPTTGTITGTVTNSSNGSAVSGVTVSAGSQTATTNASGNFTLTNVPAGSAVVNFTSNNFALQSRTVTVSAGASTTINVPVVAVTSVAFTPSVGGALSVPSSTAQVTLPANGMVQANGAAPAAGSATGRLAAINPAQSPGLMPGEFVASLSGGGTSQIESFGAFDMTFVDSAGNALNLAPGQQATIRIPLGTRSTTPPASIPLMFFNSTTGLWVQEGTATLQGTAPNQFYQGTVTHFSNWNADQVYNTTNVTVCVRDAANQPVSGARVTSDGIDYSGTGTATTNAQGSAVVPMKRGGAAAFTARVGGQSSNTLSVSAAQSGTGSFTLSPCLTLASANSGVTITLTWGSSPSDLDSHLIGPGGMHVYYVDQGSLTAVPFARLDVDDITSFGPEVVTVTRVAPGTYRYFVHNFSNTFSPGQTGSPARVEVRTSTETRVFTPASGESTNRYWHVFDFVVSSTCSITISTVNSWRATEPPNTNTGSATFCNAASELSALESQAYSARLERARAAGAVKPNKE